MASSCTIRSGRIGMAFRLLGLVTLLWTTTRAEAADRFWGSFFSAPFNAASSWQGGFIPGSGDVAHFSRTTNPNVMQLNYTVDFDVSPTNQALRVEDDFVTFDLNTRTYLTTQFVGNEIGYTAGRTGKLTIIDGIWRVDTSSDSVAIGAVGGSTGFLTVSTSGQLTGSPTIYAGLLGTGTLTVQSGGFVQSGFVMIGQQTAAIGTADVTGAGSTLNSINLRVGQFGTGTLNITAGGLVQSSLGSVIGSFADATGTAVVAGANSRWINSNALLVGDAGEGTLTIEAGGRVTSTTGVIGSQTDSVGTVTIDGFNSRWINSGSLFVGDLGTGSLTMTAGAFVQSVGAAIGAAAGSIGTVNITASEIFDSRWTNSGDMNIGGGGQGTFNLHSGSVDTTTSFIGRDAGSVGEFNISAPNAQFLCLGDLTVGHNGDGTMNVTGGGSVQSVNATVGGGADTTGVVNIAGNFSQWRSSGIVNIGLNGHGTLSLADTGYFQTDSTLYIGREVGSVGEVTVDGDNSQLSSTASLQIGNNGQGSLAITNGGDIFNVSAEIDGTGGLTGSVAVDGAGSRWINSGSLDVGDSGNGTLMVSDGGVVRNNNGIIADAPAANGVVTVTGIGSAWIIADTNFLYVGEDGTGTLNVLDGGTVSNDYAYIGFDPGSTGTATVSGAGSIWDNDIILGIGNGDDGSLTIEDGGSVVSDFAFMAGANTTGTAVVTGTGSNWSNTGLIYVGHGGSADLTIEAGATLFSRRAVIANASAATGDVTVTGTGSSWTSSEIFVVGFQGDAQVLVQSGGNVISNDAWIAGAETSTSSVTVTGAGSTWTISGRLAIGEAFDEPELGPIGGTGTLRIQPGAKVSVAQDTTLHAGATLILEGGTLDTGSVSFNGGGVFNFQSGKLHVGTFNGTLVSQGGSLAPGHSAGSTTIAGVYAQQAGGKLEIEIGGTTPGTSYDVVNITSIAGLNGQLQLALLNGFFPTGSDAFTVLTAASGIFGTFTNVANGQRLTTLDSLGSFRVNYGPGSAFNPNQIVLSAFLPAALPGDFNFDGKVDAADYVVWRKGLGTTHTQAGFNVWRANFGETLGSGAAESLSAVPEPGTAAIVTLGLSIAWLSRRRRPIYNESPTLSLRAKRLECILFRPIAG